jgi:RNA polymerase sigma factor (sigma-70 family)
MLDSVAGDTGQPTLGEFSLMDRSGDGPAALLDRAAAGDQAAWNALTDRYTNLLWSVARAMRLNEADAADAVQATWLRLVEKLGTIRDPERLAGWLSTTIRRECLAVLRQRTKMVPTEDFDELPDEDTAAVDRRLLRDEQDAALWRAFEQISLQCRTLLRVLMADPPPSYATVAVALDMPVGGIGPTRQRCLATLRRIMAVAS